MSTIIDVSKLNVDNEIRLIPASGADPEYYAADNGIVRSEYYELGNRVVFRSQGRSFSWTPNSMRYVDADGIEDTIYNVQDVPLETKANYARFNRAMPDVDDWFIQENDRLKHQILVQGFQRDPLPWLSGSIDFCFGGRIEFDADLSVRANGLVITGAFETGEQIEIIDANGNVLFTLPQVVAYDSKIPEREMTYGKYRVDSNESGVLAFDIVVDNAWISSIERVYPIVIDPTVVVASAYDTSGNGGRKIVALSNGWQIASALTATTVYFYKSTDAGATWSQLCTWSTGFGATPYFAIASSGTIIYALATATGNADVRFVKFDATSVGTTISTLLNVDSGQTSLGACSITVASDGSLHAAWASRNATYSDSFNIRYSKSTDGGATWATPSQITTNNTSGTDITNPCIVNLSNNNPIIVAQSTPAAYKILAWVWSGSAWTASAGTFITSASSVQSNPCSIVKQNGSNLGRIWTAWDGLDITDTTKRNVRASWSDDGGTTWNTAFKITSGNTIDRQNPVLTENTNGDVYVFYMDGAGISYQKCANGTTTFSGVAALASSGTNPASTEQVASSMAGVIFMDASQVKFEKLTFNVAPNAPTLITEPNFDATTAQTLAWTFSDPDAGNTQSAYQLIITKVSDGSTALDTGKVASATSSYSLTASTLTNGNQYQWKIRTWDNSDVVGPYSGLSSFHTSGKPTTTITTPATDGATITSNLTAQWSFSDPESEGQSAYQVKLTTSADAVLWDSGKVSNVSARALTINYTLVNATNYKVKITTWDAKDVASTEAVRTFITSFIVPATPTITATAQNGCIGITITNSTPSGGQPVVTGNDLYRRTTGSLNWTRIATAIANNGTYSDYSPTSGQSYDYYVQTSGNNGTSTNSATVSRSLTLKGAWLHDVTAPATTIARFKADAGRNVDWVTDVSMMQYAGRTRPVAEFGEFGTGTVSIPLQMTKQSAEIATLRALAQRRATLCYRDGRGRKMFCVISHVPESDSQWGTIANLELTEISFQEVT